MKYLFILIAGFALVSLGATPAQAGLGEPDPGCHEVYTPAPGDDEPVTVTVCP